MDHVMGGGQEMVKGITVNSEHDFGIDLVIIKYFLIKLVLIFKF